MEFHAAGDGSRGIPVRAFWVSTVLHRSPKLPVGQTIVVGKPRACAQDVG